MIYAFVWLPALFVRCFAAHGVASWVLLSLLVAVMPYNCVCCSALQYMLVRTCISIAYSRVTGGQAKFCKKHLKGLYNIWTSHHDPDLGTCNRAIGVQHG